ncbi:peroxiredoxin [Variovorax sp. GT1P44]|uniref:peroxiredoxin n=1 Tax=Variovorax sp. GT1P44 TaxID=3443742 RepID=UPI003F46B294
MARRAVASALAMLAVGVAAPADAALDVGQPAPTFSAPAAMGGKTFTYSLSAALAKGPVVLYFFPAAFTMGCSLEAHAFAEAVDKFAALGTTVIGVSTDDIDTLTKFSNQACQGKFPVASDANKSISQSFDALVPARPQYATRVSYVIAPNGTVAAEYQNLDHDKHVEKMLAAVKELPQNRDKK